MITSIENKVVLIYENELKYIRSFDLEYLDEKILFTLLVINKLNDYEGLYKTTHKKGIYHELATISNINMRSFEKRKEVISNTLNTFSNLGLIIVQSDLCIKILFPLYQNTSNDEKIIIKIFDKVGHYYDNYNKKNKIKFCKCCESPFQSGSNRNKYCSNCSSMINKLRTKDYMKKTRKKAVMFSE